MSCVKAVPSRSCSGFSDCFTDERNARLNFRMFAFLRRERTRYVSQYRTPWLRELEYEQVFCKLDEVGNIVSISELSVSHFVCVDRPCLECRVCAICVGPLGGFVSQAHGESLALSLRGAYSLRSLGDTAQRATPSHSREVPQSCATDVGVSIAWCPRPTQCSIAFSDKVGRLAPLANKPKQRGR